MSSEALGQEEYVKVSMQLGVIGAAVGRMELRRFLRTGEIAEATGPLIDPTAWIRDGDMVVATVKFARAALKFREAWEEYRTVLEALHARGIR